MRVDSPIYCPWLDAANSFWPLLVSTTDVALPRGRPLLALKPSTVTSATTGSALQLVFGNMTTLAGATQKITVRLG